MIKDNRIDLTLNNDFQHSFESRDMRNADIRSRIPLEKCTFIAEAGFGKIPWRYHEFGKRDYMNVNNDYLSGEFGADIYFTSDNHYLVTDDEHTYQRKTADLNRIMEEFFIEVVGYLPNTLEKYCYSCGRRFIDYTGAIECEHCRKGWMYDHIKREVLSEVHLTN